MTHLQIHSDGTITDWRGNLAGFVTHNPRTKTWTAKPHGNNATIKKFMSRLMAIDHIRRHVGYCEHRKTL